MTESYSRDMFRTTIVCIDSYENGILSGRLYHPKYENGDTFSGVIQLLLKIDRILDDNKFPQAFTQYRSFASRSEVEYNPIVGEQQKGAIATFTIRVLFRQNTTWQGTIHWAEGSQNQEYRSVLEMLFLMDSALQKTGQQK